MVDGDSIKSRRDRMDKLNIINGNWAKKETNISISVNEIIDKYNSFVELMHYVEMNYEYEGCEHSEHEIKLINELEEWLLELEDKAINADD